MPRLRIGNRLLGVVEGYARCNLLGAVVEQRSAVLSVGDVGVADQVTPLQLYRLRCGAMVFPRCGSGRNQRKSRSGFGDLSYLEQDRLGRAILTKQKPRLSS